MPCTSPAQASSPPTLAQLLAELRGLDSAGAERHQEDLDDVEQLLADARAVLSEAESALAGVQPAGTREAYRDWAMRHSHVCGARRALRRLDVEQDALRQEVERALFLARQARASAQVPCRDCRGTGEGVPLDGGTCLVPSSCDACHGEGTSQRQS